MSSPAGSEDEGLDIPEELCNDIAAAMTFYFGGDDGSTRGFFPCRPSTRFEDSNDMFRGRFRGSPDPVLIEDPPDREDREAANHESRFWEDHNAPMPINGRALDYEPPFQATLLEESSEDAAVMTVSGDAGASRSCSDEAQKQNAEAFKFLYDEKVAQLIDTNRDEEMRKELIQLYRDIAQSGCAGVSRKLRETSDAGQTSLDSSEHLDENRDDCFQAALENCEPSSSPGRSEGSHHSQASANARLPLGAELSNMPAKSPPMQHSPVPSTNGVSGNNTQSNGKKGKDKVIREKIGEVQADSVSCVMTRTPDIDDVDHERREMHAATEDHTTQPRPSRCATSAEKPENVEATKASSSRTQISPIPTRTLRSGKVVALIVPKPRARRIKQHEQIGEPNIEKAKAAQYPRRSKRGKQAETEKGGKAPVPSQLPKLRETRKRKRR